MGGRAGACARHRVWPSACPWCVRVWRIALPNLFCYAESPPLSAPLSYPNLTLLDLAARHCPLPPASRRHRRHRRGRSVTTGRRTSAPALIPETPGLRSTLNKSLGMDPAMLSQNIDLLRSQSQPIKSEADAEGDERARGRALGLLRARACDSSLPCHHRHLSLSSYWRCSPSHAPLFLFLLHRENYPSKH